MNYNIQFTVSIQYNSNKIIGSSEENFGGIGKGNLIKIGQSNVLHTIIGKDKFSYLKSFSIKDSKTLLIDEDIGINLQKGDCLKLSYKEYELMMIYDIVEMGSNYNIGNELKATGGIINIDVSTGRTNPTILKVVALDLNSGAKQLEIIEKGKYLSPPENPVSFTSDSGQGAKFELKYKECDNRTIIERNIQDIHIKEGKTFINLDYSLPLNVKQGKLYVEKYVLILDSPYMGDTELNINYELFRNFTPYLRMPMLLKNSMSPDVILNKSLIMIDEELFKIKQKLGI